MGRKQEPKEEQKKPEPKPEAEEAKAEEEDSPIVKELKGLDDKYLEIERQYEKDVEELKKKFLDRQKPLLEERQKLLVGEVADQDGTPKLPIFWRKAMANHPAFEDNVEEWDEPVLNYLRNVTCEPTGDNAHCFKLTFSFTANPYFEPLEIVKEYQAVESSPYTQDVDVKKNNMYGDRVEARQGRDSGKDSKKGQGRRRQKSEAKG